MGISTNKRNVQSKKGEIDLRYLDENGFSLKSGIFDVYPEKSEQITLNSCLSKIISVLELRVCKNELNHTIYQAIIDTKIVFNF